MQTESPWHWLKIAKLKAKANKNLSGAKGMWSIYGERWPLKAALMFHYGLTILAAFWLAVYVDDIVVLVVLTVVVLIGSYHWLAMYWDELAWVGPKLQPSPFTAFPWRPGLHIFYRTPPNARDNAPPSLARTSKKKVEPDPIAYGLAFGSDPEGYPQLKAAYREPPDSPVIVSPIWLDADRVKDTHGIGYWDGEVYRVPVQRVVFLGVDGGAQGIKDPKIRRLLEACPNDIRREIYKLRPESKWWRLVFISEEAPTRKAGAPQPNELMVAQLEELRAQVALLKDENQAWIDDYNKLRKVAGR